MKWYMALNEGGTRGDIALHTKIAVLSARKYTQLQPKMLYIGERNDFTRWLEREGVEVLDQTLPYMDVIDRLVEEGRYNKSTVGHWLRTNVCLAERDDTHVLYTDVDIMFRKTPDLSWLEPQILAAAPEHDRHSWNYFNAGVMVANVEALRRDYAEFEDYLRRSIYEKTHRFHDQIAYNIFYQHRWDRLPLTLNWKPYWGIEPDAELIHFHGPKIGAIESIVNGRWNWNSDHEVQIGTMLADAIGAYRHYIAAIISEIDGLSDEEIELLRQLSSSLNKFVPDPNQRMDRSNMRHRMFPEPDSRFS